jgi:hypothetical protein
MFVSRCIGDATMSNPRSGAVRQPANELAAFDISRQSPDDIARLFGRWKEQRKRLLGDEPPARPPRSTRFMPVVVRSSGPAEVAPEPVVAEQPSQPGAIRYSAPFADLLATRQKEGIAQRVRAFALKPAERRMLHVATRRPKLRWVLAGAASLLAVAAASAAVLWQPSAPRQSSPAQAQLAPAAHSGAARPPVSIEVVNVPIEVQPAERFLPMAVQQRHERAEWQLALEIALLQPMPVEAEVAQAHLTPKLKPKIVAQTASQPTQKSVPAAQHEPMPQMVIWTKARSGEEEVSVAVPPETAPVTSAVAEKRPDSFYRRGNDKAAGGGGHIGQASSSANKSRGDDASGGPGTGDSAGAGDSPGGGAPGGSPGSGSDPGGAGGPGHTGGGDTGSGSGDSGSDAGSGDNTGGQSGDTGGSGESGSDGGSSSGDQSGDSQGDGSGSSKPDKPQKGAGVDAHVGIGGGGIGASVGGHVGGIGGGLSAGIGQ